MTESRDVYESNSYIDAEITGRLAAIEDSFGADVLSCIAPIQQPIDDFIRQLMDDLPDRRENLLVILETDGG